MNITVDIGNTHQTFRSASGVITPLSEFDLDSPNNSIWVSSVNDKLLNLLPTKRKMIRDYFKEGNLNNMPVNYSKSIGDDRLAGAYFLFKKNELNKLHIDTGTFTTVDFITKNGFEGGYILPGIHSLSQTYEKGKNLHSPNYEDFIFPFQEIPHNTKDAINLGCLITYLSPIKELINLLRPEEVYLSGGSARFLAKNLENRNYIIEDNIVHKGLRKLSEDLK